MRMTLDVSYYGPTLNGGAVDFGLLADISGKVCQGLYSPQDTALQLDSPYRFSAKHLLLRAYLPLKTPFRSMLLTVRGVPHCLTPRAHRVPCIPEGVSTILTCRLHGALERYSRFISAGDFVTILNNRDSRYA